jgi:transcriptional regulator with XRE-family HTH domain
MRSRLTQQAGVAVRKLRLSKGWTLAQLSDRSGVPLSTLSKLELGQSSLTYDKLMRICQALEVDPGLSLLREADTAPTSSARRSVTRAGEGQSHVIGPHPARLAAPDLLSKSFSPLLLDLIPANAGQPPRLHTLSGDAYVYVLEGEVVLFTRVYAPLQLAAGDSVYFDGAMDHALAPANGAASRALLIIAGDEAERMKPNEDE